MNSDDRLVGSDRVLAVLVELGNHPDGIALDDLSRIIRSPKPTVHRALASLRRAGLAAQDGYGRYAIGDEFIRIAYSLHEARPDHVRVASILDQLCQRHGETVHFAVLDGKEVVYRSKLDPPSGAMRLTSTVGGRNPAHATGVGKLLLALTLPDLAAVAHWVGDHALASPQAKTLTTVSELHEEFERIRDQGFAVDDEENELGINCVAVPVYFSSPRVPSGAISVSALKFRTPLRQLVHDIEAIKHIASGRALADPAATAAS